VDEIALIRDTINHYGPVFIAFLSIQIRRAGVQKKFGGPAAPGSVIAGGILYSAGVVFHLWDQLRFQNAIWHAFVVAAAAFQYAAVFSSVLAATA
jgi:channel protein (hemolysin III family)